MLEEVYPVQWAGRQAVVALPEQIDVSNAGQIREELLAVINRGATALIADMTATMSCDYAGADAVVRASQRAVISGTDLRLVVTAPMVRQVLSVGGVDRLVSIYPSVEAATAAWAPAPVLALVAEIAAGANGQAPSRRGRPAVRFVPACPADRNGAAVTRAVVRELADALAGGVALADADGTIALANARLEEMFGYRHGELPGHPVESLIPAGLGPAGGSDAASYAPADCAQPMGAGARLVGCRRNGTTFPVEVSLSPMLTAAGHFALVVIRDVTEARRLEDLASFAVTAVAAEQEHRGQEVLDTIVTSLFHVGLSLQAAADLPAESVGQRIAEALGHLDDTIRVIRDTAFTTRVHRDVVQVTS